MSEEGQPDGSYLSCQDWVGKGAQGTAGRRFPCLEASLLSQQEGWASALAPGLAGGGRGGSGWEKAWPHFLLKFSS